MSYEDIQIFCENYEYGQETRREESVYDKAGLINVVTDVPVAIFHYDGKQVVVLSANQTFRQIIRQALPDYNGKDLLLRIENLSFRQRLQPCLDELIASGQEHVVTYIEENHYLRLHLGLIGGPQGRYLCRAWIYNIADAREDKEAHRINYLLRNIATSSNSIRDYII